jgi:hypothetical protein
VKPGLTTPMKTVTVPERSPGPACLPAMEASHETPTYTQVQSPCRQVRSHTLNQELKMPSHRQMLPQAHLVLKQRLFHRQRLSPLRPRNDDSAALGMPKNGKKTLYANKCTHHEIYNQCIK